MPSFNLIGRDIEQNLSQEHFAFQSICSDITSKSVLGGV